MNFLEKLDYLKERGGLNNRTLSIQSGIPYSTIDSMYRIGYENTKLSTVKKLCVFFDVSMDYFMLDEITDPEYGKGKDFVATLRERNMIEKIRTLDPHGNQMVSYVLDAEYRRVQQILSVSRGEAVGDSKTIAVPILKDALSHKVVGTVPISAIGKDYGSESDLFALKVTRDTMSPRIAPGDTVIVRKQNDVNSGDIAVVLLDGIQVVCKQVIKDGDTLHLVPLNSQYETMSFRKEDLRKRKFEILGRVIENVQAV